MQRERLQGLYRVWYDIMHAKITLAAAQATESRQAGVSRGEVRNCTVVKLLTSLGSCCRYGEKWINVRYFLEKH